MRYSTGIFETDCGVNVNHAVTHSVTRAERIFLKNDLTPSQVLAVGFGADLFTEFFKMKNSWGTTWGEAGYIRMKRGVRADQTGICSIATRASYPTL